MQEGEVIWTWQSILWLTAAFQNRRLEMNQMIKSEQMTWKSFLYSGTLHLLNRATPGWSIDSVFVSLLAMFGLAGTSVYGEQGVVTGVSQSTSIYQALQAANVILTPGGRWCQGWSPRVRRRSVPLHNWCHCHNVYGSSTWQRILTEKCDIFRSCQFMA